MPRFGLVLILLSACAPRGPELVRLPADDRPAVVIERVAVLDVESGSVAEKRDVLLVRAEHRR